MLILKNYVTVHIAKCKNSNARTPQNFKGHAEDLHYITYTECTLGQLAYLFMANKGNSQVNASFYSDLASEWLYFSGAVLHCGIAFQLI